MCELSEDNILSELLYDTLLDKIPVWFDEYKSDLLTKALEKGELATETEEIKDLIEAKIYPVVTEMVRGIFSGERIRDMKHGEEDICDKTKEILGIVVDDMKLDADFEYETLEGEVKEAMVSLRRLKARLKKLPKSKTKRGRK